MLRRRKILVNRWRPPSPSSAWPPGLRAWPVSELGSPSRSRSPSEVPRAEALQVSPAVAEKGLPATLLPRAGLAAEAEEGCAEAGEDEAGSQATVRTILPALAANDEQATVLPRTVSIAVAESEDGNSAPGEEQLRRESAACESAEGGGAILLPRRRSRATERDEEKPQKIKKEVGRGVLQLTVATGARFECGQEPLSLCSSWCIRPALCISGSACPWAHGVRELRESARAICEVSRFLHTGFTPRRACSDFAAGYCKNGVRCSFAHGAAEIALIRLRRPAARSVAKKLVTKEIRKRIGRRWTTARHCSDATF